MIWNPHEGNCSGTLCGYCRCCTHTTDPGDCKVAASPAGAGCPEPGCGCEGYS